MEKGKGLYVFSRYFAAFLLILYGFSKITGTQFSVVDWVLDEPLGEVSGFWLTWYYFGYSTTYSMIIALVQVGGGILLLFRRTALLASVVLIGVMANIVLVNVFFGIASTAMTASLVITGCLLVVLWTHREELLTVFWSMQGEVNPFKVEGAKARFAKGAVRVLVITVPLFITYWAANHNLRSATPLDGTWDVVRVSGEMERSELPTRIYFEPNRAYQTVFRYPESISRHHFLVDVEDRRLDLWEQWLQRGEKLFTGTYDLRGDTLAVEGLFDQEGASVQLLLARAPRE